MSWYSYEDAREQRAELEREICRRKKAGEKLEQITAPPSGKIARTFWGHAWCRHLEGYSEYESRLPRGRSYLRKGNVYDLKIGDGVVTAAVAGSYLYSVKVEVQPLKARDWERFKKECAGEVVSLLDLLSGRLGEAVLRRITDVNKGLFPAAHEIRFDCSCPDYVDLCKHTASVLYAIGVCFDTAPELFFKLRKVDPAELIASGGQALPTLQGTDIQLEGEDLSALFGIDLALDEPLPPLPTTGEEAKRSPGKTVSTDGAKQPLKARAKKTAKPASPKKEQRRKQGT